MNNIISCYTIRPTVFDVCEKPITVYLRVLVEKFSPEQNTTQTICLIHG